MTSSLASRLSLAATVLAVVCAACAPASKAAKASTPLPADPPTSTPEVTATATETASPTPIPPSATPTHTATAAPSGPKYEEGVNPLTGLPMEDPAPYRRAPLLVSITNFPPSARPQAGLSQADHVWETSIAEGLTRFLAVYYGDYPARLSQLALAADPPRDHVLAPIRSGRVAFDDIRAFYPGSLLVTRAASAEVLPQLGNQLTVYALDPEDVNSAGLTPAELDELPLEVADPSDYGGLRFHPIPPPGGSPAPELAVIFNLYAQFSWSYDDDLGAYVRSQDPADGSGQQRPLLDRLTAKPLAFENVVVLFARDKLENPAGTILEIELRYLTDRLGLLFRDGRIYDIHWSTRRDQFRLLDEEGRDFPLKPGRTFFEVVNFRTTWDEEARVLRYHSPPLPTPTFTPTFTPSPEPTETPEATETSTP